MKKPFIVVIIAIVWFLGTVGIIATLGGCSTWTNYIHEQAQEEYRQEIAEDAAEAAFFSHIERREMDCIEFGGEWTESGCWYDEPEECFLLDKTPVPCEDIEPISLRSAEEMFDDQGAYIYKKEKTKRRHEEAQRDIERSERQYEIDKIHEERDNAKKDAGTK